MARRPAAYECDHDWIWCLDSDALPRETTLSEMLSATYPSQRPIVAKTCVLRDPQTGHVHPGGALDRSSGPPELSFAPSAWEGKIMPVDIATLRCLLVRADAAQRAGFIRRDFFVHLDEAFLSHQPKMQGEIIQIGTVFVSHLEGKGRYIMGPGGLVWLWRTIGECIIS